MRKEFERFMKENGWWDAFVNNLKKDIDIFFQENDPCDYLAGAFVFADTPEGFKSWNDIQSKWGDHCKILNKQ